jgi:thiamine biosynthesis lipoprotein
MKRFLIIAGLIALIGALVLKSRPATAPRELHGTAMGCRWTLSWRGDKQPPDVLRREISATLEHWEQVLSQWRPNSDLSLYNRGAPPTPDLARVLAMAEEIKTATGGAFDHHILEKVHAAGFGPAGNGVDLSSIGKGFGVDRVGERLRELGVNDFAFNLAGEVLAGDGEWRVEVERPDPAASIPQRTLGLKNRAIATTGNYRQFIPSEDGLRCHIIDPKTGRSVIRPLSSVTVMATDCATASSWATAGFVLGPDFKGYPQGMEASWQGAKPSP